MKYTILVFIILSIISCTKIVDSENDNFSINWLVEYNDITLQRIKMAVEQKGNRTNDSMIFAKVKKIVFENRNLIDAINKSNKADQIHSFLERHENNTNSYKENINTYLSVNNFDKISIIELKRRILLYELKELSLHGSRIGENDISFDNLDIFFIPDDYSKINKTKIKGRLIFAAMSERIAENAAFYFGENKIKEVDGCGVVDFDFNEIIDKDSIEIKIKFPEWEIKKSILLK